MENLETLKKGNLGKVLSISGNSRFLSRISSIGITIGSTVEVIQNEKKYPVLIYQRDTLIALNREESKKIMVEVIK